MTPAARARLAELTAYRRRRATGELCCLGCGDDTLSTIRHRCPPCMLQRARSRARRRDARRGGSAARQDRRMKVRARHLLERLEGDDVDLF